MINDMLKADGWMTSGWRLVDGERIEVGHVRGIVSDPEPSPSDARPEDL